MVRLVDSLRSRPHPPALWQDPQRSWTSLGRSRVNPCASAHWSGMSGCLANPTPNTGYEPNFYSYLNEEHTPINLLDCHRSFPRRDDATIISTTEDPEGFATLRSIQQQRANRSKQGSHNVRIFREHAGRAESGNRWRDHESVDSRNGIQETGANLDRESVVSILLKFTVKREERSRSKRCAFVKRQRKSPENPWTESWLGRSRRENGSA